MSARKLESSLANLDRALSRLEEALAVPPEAPLAIDGTIQRFEFALELMWKTIRRALEHEGLDSGGSPRRALKAAYAAGWLDDEPLWLAMLEDRNATSHIDDEARAREIYERIRTYVAALRTAANFLGKRVEGAG